MDKVTELADLLCITWLRPIDNPICLLGVSLDATRRNVMFKEINLCLEKTSLTWVAVQPGILQCFQDPPYILAMLCQ